MGKNSKIEWCDHTFNPWIGCQKIGPGCDHCYAEAWAKRSGQVSWGPGADRRRTSESNWRQPIQWNEDAKNLGVRSRVFCASLGDVFDKCVPRKWREDLFDQIADTPNLDWLLLTKRIGNAKTMVQETLEACCFTKKVLETVWLGITICNQKEADRDIPELLKAPAVRRFLSIEPMLEQIHLDGTNHHVEALAGWYAHVDWVIVGGESGPKARPMHPDWVRSIRDQCAAAGTPFLFKSWGDWASAMDMTGTTPIKWEFEDGRRPELSPRYDRMKRLPRYVFNDFHQMIRIGKKRAGRLLDGAIHSEYPEILEPAIEKHRLSGNGGKG